MRNVKDHYVILNYFPKKIEKKKRKKIRIVVSVLFSMLRLDWSIFKKDKNRYYTIQDITVGTLNYYTFVV